MKKMLSTIIVPLFLMSPLVAQQDGIIAQTPSATPLAFDVATIKESGDTGGEVSNHTGGPGTDSPTLYRRNIASVADMIRVAWNIEPYQLVTDIALDKTNYDIVARLPVGTSHEQYLEMFRNLLTDRFALKTHMETRDLPVYEMLVGDHGLKIKEVPDTPHDPSAPKPPSQTDWRVLQPGRPGVLSTMSTKSGDMVFHVTVQMQTLEQFSKWLRSDLPIVDHTGMTGKYSFAFDYARQLPGRTSDELPEELDLTEALRSELGVKLVKRKLPVSVLVVDSVNPRPTPN
jgi:uncharacterized protein (TIGR03435 family)